jgi:hypothetical protein
MKLYMHSIEYIDIHPRVFSLIFDILYVISIIGASRPVSQNGFATSSVPTPLEPLEQRQPW